jgi:phenylacetic acid degradation operon negative regulatory protein
VPRASAKSLILDLLSTLDGRAMPVRALIAAGDLFGVSAESVRVALVRLLERGTVARDERGQYRISSAGEAVQRHVVAWHQIEARLVPWGGGWVAAHTTAAARADRAAMRRSARALAFLGLRELEPGLWLRPDNLAGGVEAVRRELIGLGLSETSPVFGIQQLDARSDARARALWRSEEIRRGYRDMRARLARSAGRLAALDAPQAMVESFLIGGEAIRLVVLDPLLPEPLVPAAERRALVDELRQYDRLGRERWRPFMQQQGAPHPRAPFNPHTTRPQPTPAAAAGG